MSLEFRVGHIALIPRVLHEAQIHSLSCKFYLLALIFKDVLRRAL